jgi:hypothetical protein
MKALLLFTAFQMLKHVMKIFLRQTHPEQYLQDSKASLHTDSIEQMH